jgi:hypothetical protein
LHIFVGRGIIIKKEQPQSEAVGFDKSVEKPTTAYLSRGAVVLLAQKWVSRLNAACKSLPIASRTANTIS